MRSLKVRMEYLLEEGYPKHTEEIRNLFLEMGGFNLQVFDHVFRGRDNVLSCYI